MNAVGTMLQRMLLGANEGSGPDDGHWGARQRATLLAPQVGHHSENP